VLLPGPMLALMLPTRCLPEMTTADTAGLFGEGLCKAYGITQLEGRWLAVPRTALHVLITAETAAELSSYLTDDFEMRALLRRAHPPLDPPRCTKKSQPDPIVSSGAWSR
jgi:hypothetical protein